MAVALVTGTSSGIGLATAVALARAGHTVAATMRNLNAAGDIERIVAVEKLPVVVSELNVNDDASVVNGVAGIVSRYGPIDILVNNAGIPGGVAIEETSLELFRNVMETNFFGGLRCIKAVVTSMRERRKGVIVNVTSVAGRVACRRKPLMHRQNGRLRRSARSLRRSSKPSTFASPLSNPALSQRLSSKKALRWSRIVLTRICGDCGRFLQPPSQAQPHRMSSPSELLR
jgi:NAD(P)-dependent dehydrogenase (short-subunit alcohol dehydrogenase family)